MAERVKLLPDTPKADDDTELAWVDGKVFVLARKHEEVVELHARRADLAEDDLEQLLEAVREHRATWDESFDMDPPTRDRHGELMAEVWETDQSLYAVAREIENRRKR